MSVPLEAVRTQDALAEKMNKHMSLEGVYYQFHGNNNDGIFSYAEPFLSLTNAGLEFNSNNNNLLHVLTVTGQE